MVQPQICRNTSSELSDNFFFAWIIALKILCILSLWWLFMLSSMFRGRIFQKLWLESNSSLVYHDFLDQWVIFWSLRSRWHPCLPFCKHIHFKVCHSFCDGKIVLIKQFQNWDGLLFLNMHGSLNSIFSLYITKYHIFWRKKKYTFLIYSFLRSFITDSLETLEFESA